MMDTVFNLSLATPYLRNVPPPENGFAQASVSLPWLAEKLMADIANGEKIFVARPREAQQDAAGLAVLAALRRFGDVQLLWVVEDGSGPRRFGRSPSLRAHQGPQGPHRGVHDQRSGQRLRAAAPAGLIPSCLEADASTGRKHFFLKKEARTFGHLAHASGQR
jgi:hypothetical protein